MSNPVEGNAVLVQFNRLIEELLGGTLYRNTFEPWELELLVEVHSCSLKGAAIQRLLREYQEAVQRHMRNGAPIPLKLSEYLESHKVEQVRPWQEPIAASAIVTTTKDG